VGTNDDGPMTAQYADAIRERLLLRDPRMPQESDGHRAEILTALATERIATALERIADALDAR
jgi:hypothetical protein